MVIQNQTLLLAGISGVNAATMRADWRSTFSGSVPQKPTFEKRGNRGLYFTSASLRL